MNLCFNKLQKKGYLNDVWTYYLEKDEWEWISGSNKLNQRGIYGEKKEIR